MTDKERCDWMERQFFPHNVMVSRHRVKGTFRITAVIGAYKGVGGFRKAVDRAIERERGKKEKEKG